MVLGRLLGGDRLLGLLRFRRILAEITWY
jgi:hypothetical protein